MDNKLIHERFISGRQKLDYIKSELKKDFFGIDDVIDRIVDSLECWYLLPEAIVFPVIVNLWGLTGVGKTDLVRKLAVLLGFKDKFVEIQMDGFSNGSGYRENSISAILEGSSIQEGEQGIVLLDEFQRFRTIEGNGADIKVERYQDVWMLLGNGQFASDCSWLSTLEYHLAQEDYWDDYKEHPAPPDPAKEAAKEATEEAKKPKRFKTSIWQAQSFKKMLKLKESLQEIMEWEKEYLVQRVRECIKDQSGLTLDYSKVLVFVCGNLDEAFAQMSHKTEDCDTDADVYYKLSKKISVFNVKQVLKTRFKPEQIARMGNNHIIYPSLSRIAYQQIIERTCRRYLDTVNEKTGVQFIAEPQMLQEIYTNSVFPTQGTRPVFSSIHKILSSSPIQIVLWAFDNNVTKVSLTIDVERSMLCALSEDGRQFCVPVILDVNVQKKKNSIDFNTLVAVHEAGHAIVHCVTKLVAPTEVKINIASFKGGFTSLVDGEIYSKDCVEKHIAICFAGLVAEELVFGTQYRSTGAESDIGLGTFLAARYVKLWGFNGFVGTIRLGSNNEWANTEIAKAAPIIEELCKQQKNVALDILRQYSKPFEILVHQLIANDTVTNEELVVIMDPYLKITQKDDVTPPYSHIWKQHQQ
jgi:cell division protease FtsH